MLIDNTMYSMYSKCPLMYRERYEADDYAVQQKEALSKRDGSGKSQQETESVAFSSGSLSLANRGGDGALPILGQPPGGQLQPGIELDEPSEGRDFGTRFHQLLDARRRRGLGQPVPAELQAEWPDEDIEAESQATLAAYEAHYVRDYEYLESERTHTLDLPERCPICWHAGVRSLDLPSETLWCNTCNRAFGRHQLIVKLDAVVRHADGTIGPFDTKTESRQGYNTREDWAGKTQAKIYLYALGSLYPAERVSRLVVDVVTRGSPKARRGPIFTRLDDITHSPESIDEFLRNVVWTCDDIERSRKLGWWRSNTNLCKKGWEKCDYFFIHVDGRTEANLRKYRPAEDYLGLDL